MAVLALADFCKALHVKIFLSLGGVFGFFCV
jgi:hypothetical protein